MYDAFLTHNSTQPSLVSPESQNSSVPFQIITIKLSVARMCRSLSKGLLLGRWPRGPPGWRTSRLQRRPGSETTTLAEDGRASSSFLPEESCLIEGVFCVCCVCVVINWESGDETWSITDTVRDQSGAGDGQAGRPRTKPFQLPL